MAGNPVRGRARRIGTLAVYLTLFLLVAGGFFHFVYRPWQMNWGATDEEVNRRMVGDDIVENANFITTRAITIDATPEQIWPWIVQVGYKRAGFYSYDFLDNAGIPSANRIIPEFQDLKVGDPVPLSQGGTIRVAALEPNEYLVLGSGPSGTMSWAWGLYETDGKRTRLVCRLRIRMPDIGMKIGFEAFEIWMMRRHLLGIRERAESLAERQGVRKSPHTTE